MTRTAGAHKRFSAQWACLEARGRLMIISVKIATARVKVA